MASPSSVAWCVGLRQECVKSSVACASGLRRVAWRGALRWRVGVRVCLRSLRTSASCARRLHVVRVPMRLKLPAHNACVVFRRLGSWFPREIRAFASLTFGKSAARRWWPWSVCIFIHWRSVRRMWREHPRMTDVPQTSASRKARTGQPHGAQAERLGCSLTIGYALYEVEDASETRKV